VLDSGGFLRLRNERSEMEQVEKPADVQAHVTGIILFH